MTDINMQPSTVYALASHLEEPLRFAPAHGIIEGEAADFNRGSC